MPRYYLERLIRMRLAWMLMYEQTGNAKKICRTLAYQPKHSINGTNTTYPLEEILIV